MEHPQTTLPSAETGKSYSRDVSHELHFFSFLIIIIYHFDPVVEIKLFMANRSDGPEIRDVWSANLEAEMENIRGLIDNYPFIAMVRRFHILFYIL